MTTVNPVDFIEELNFDIKVRDMIKARLVLAHLEAVPANAREAAFSALTGGPADFVIALIVSVAAENRQSAETHAALEAVLLDRVAAEPELLAKLLMREVHPGHRRILVALAGKIKLTSAAGTLLALLREERDERVLRELIQALGLIGDPSAVSALSEYLYSGSVELVIAAVRALARIGTSTACRRLFEKLGADSDLDGLILEALACSSEPQALQCINSALSLPSAGPRNAAKQRLTSLGPKALPILFGNLQDRNTDLLIHTLNIFGSIGDAAAISHIRKLLHRMPEDANVRFAAYEALAQLPADKGSFALAHGMNDPDESVKAAVARAIDHNYNPTLSTGIQNIIMGEKGSNRPISRLFMECECDTVFLDLIGAEHFRCFAASYLKQQAHADLRRHFAPLLRAAGTGALADDIEKGAEPAGLNNDGHLVFVVDDSRTILNIYRNQLAKTGCRTRLFEFPAEAIREIENEKPDLVFTDLNMPEINGFELTRTIRKRFCEQELPIIMVTTQGDCRDDGELQAAGINAILQKPFSADMLQAVMRQHLGH